MAKKWATHGFTSDSLISYKILDMQGFAHSKQRKFENTNKNKLILLSFVEK